MKRKKLTKYISLFAVFTLILVMIPLQALYAHPQIDLTTGAQHLADCGTNQHSIYYNVKDSQVAVYWLDKNIYQPPGWNSSSNFFKVVWKNVNGETFSVDISGIGSPAIDGYDVYYNSLVSVAVDEQSGGADIVWIKVYYTGDSNADCVWVRDHDMVCKTVWINEDNNFEFIFDYYHAKNNWVKIYDMDGNMVWETNFAYGKNRFVAELPDGMYTVKTFHNNMDEPIQEFVIGKP